MKECRLGIGVKERAGPEPGSWSPGVGYAPSFRRVRRSKEEGRKCQEAMFVLISINIT